MSTQLVTGADVWPKLKELGASTSGPRSFATAYLGDGAGDQLGLRAGDTLVVALSEGNAKNGSVSPREIRRLMRRGVETYVEEQLHAKVYLFGDTVAVGSPNLSRHSEAVLHEALLVSTEAEAVGVAEAWFEDLRAVPVTPEWLEHCLAVYKPPKIRAMKVPRKAIEGRLWLVGVREMEFPEDEVREEGEDVAEAELAAGYQIETLRFTGKTLFAREVKPGDLLIQVWKEGETRRVYPHARVVGVRRTTSRRETGVLYVYLEACLEPRTRPWPEFRREMAGAGLTLGEGVSTRELKGQRIVARAKSLTRIG